MESQIRIAADNNRMVPAKYLYQKNVFSAGIELIQFISRLCLCYCSTRLKACLQGICDWIVLVFKVLQELIDSSRSRFPLWRLPFVIPPTLTFRVYFQKIFFMAYACLFPYFVCVSV